MTAPGIAFYAAPDAGLDVAEARAGVEAISAGLAEDFCPRWSRLPIAATFYTSAGSIPPGTPTIQLARKADVPGALAYHTESSRGAIVGLVGVETCRDDGVSWTSAADHEAKEAARNPFVNGYTVMPGHGGLWLVADETCDPVQDGSYRRGGIELSNFVTPAWFDELGGGPFDFLLALSRPFSKTSGGYFEVNQGGKMVQVGMKGHDRHTRIVHGVSLASWLRPVALP